LTHTLVSPLPQAPVCTACAVNSALDFEFTMAFQPIVDLEQRTIFAYEALVRGLQNEPAGRILARVNEQNRYRFDQMCRVKAIELANRLDMSAHLSINFMPNAVYRAETCLRTTLQVARRLGFPRERIIFEITEGERIVDHAHLREIVREYKRQGFKTAIDDFGAGYAGLNLLTEFQPDIIKLDMGLIRHIDQDRVRQVIVHGTLHICRELGIQVIAEGVETRAELDFLRDAGIHLFQGYYFARPGFQILPTVAPHAWV
jgi:EAL domain-containing protein (putative c-di-GMP-specific phosphodiesterase class I)